MKILKRILAPLTQKFRLSCIHSGHCSVSQMLSNSFLLTYGLRTGFICVLYFEGHMMHSVESIRFHYSSNLDDLIDILPCITPMPGCQGKALVLLDSLKYVEPSRYALNNSVCLIIISIELTKIFDGRCGNSWLCHENSWHLIEILILVVFNLCKK